MTTAEKLTRLKIDIDETYNKGYEDGKAEGGGDNELFESIVDGSISGNIITNVESIRANAFHSCPNITSFSAPNAKTIGNTSFVSCSSLQKINFPTLIKFSVQTFYGCRALQHIYAPLVNSLSTGTFQGCNLLIVKLPSLKYTTANGFTNNTQLKTCYTPALEGVGNGGFSGCSNLKALIINTVNCILSNVNAFTGSGVESGTGFIYVPDESVETYKTATNWNIYADQIKGLSEIPQDILDELEVYNYGN